MQVLPCNKPWLCLKTPSMKNKSAATQRLEKHSAVDIFIPIDHNCDTAFPSSNIMSSRTNSFHQLLSDILMILLFVSVFIDLYSMSYVWESHSSWAEKGTSGGNQYIIPFTLNHAPPLILWWCSAALLDHFAANFRGLQRNVPCLTRCNLNRAHQQRFWALFHWQLALRSQAIETRCEDEEAPVAPAKMQNNAK